MPNKKKESKIAIFRNLGIITADILKIMFPILQMTKKTLVLYFAQYVTVTWPKMLAQSGKKQIG